MPSSGCAEDLDRAHSVIRCDGKGHPLGRPMEGAEPLLETVASRDGASMDKGDMSIAREVMRSESRAVTCILPDVKTVLFLEAPEKAVVPLHEKTKEYYAVDPLV